MSKKLFQEKMDELLACFPTWQFDKENSTQVNVWYNKLKGFEEKDFKKMINKYIENERFNPTIAGLLQQVKDTRTTEFDPEVDAF